MNYGKKWRAQLIRRTPGPIRAARKQRHLPGRLAGPDDAQELRLVALFPAKDAQAARPKEEELVGRVARFEKDAAAGQGEPCGVALQLFVGEQLGERGVDRNVRQAGHGDGA